MSENTVEITESSNYTISIDTSLVQNNNNIELKVSSPNVIDVINNTTILVGDLPQGYPLNWTTGDLPVSRVSGLIGESGISYSSGVISISEIPYDLIPVHDIVAGSGIGISSSNGIFNIAVTGSFGLSSEQVDDRVNNLLNSGSYINLNYNDATDSLTISVTGLQPSGNYSIVGHNHNIAEINGLQNTLDNKQPIGIYASGIHYHTSSDITNFNSSVDSRIVSANLQPSGNYSVVGHQHLSSDITNFTSSVSGLLPVKNISSGSGINVTNTSGNFVVAVTGQFGLTSEQVDDRISDLLTGIDNIILTYDDNLNKLTIGTSGLQPSGNYSLVGHSHNINDIAGLQNNLDSKQPSGEYANQTHYHVSNDISDFANSVSGLLPSVSGSGYISSSYSNNSYIISVSGLQPSGSYASSAHTHVANEITDFNSSVSGLVNGIYAPLISPSFSGVPTAPTAPNGTNNTQIANTSFVRTEISNLINSAPSTLDTLNELANALGNDPNFATTIASGLATKANIVHSHVSSDISNFNSSVSGLLPVTNIIGSSGIVVSNSGSIYNINSSGLAFISGANFDNLSVSGNTVSVSGHSHSYSDISNWSTGIEQEIHTLLVAGNYINIAYDNTYDTLTVSASGLQPAGNYADSVHSHGNISSSGTIGSTSGLLVTTGTNGALTTSSGINSNYVTNFNSAVSGLLPSVSGSGYVISSFSDNIYSIAVTGLQPSGNYSVVGHTHTTSNISDFNSSVSGLLPSISGSGYVQSSFNNNSYTISVSGLQPSGDYANSVHNHTVSDIINFNSSVSGLLPVKELIAGTGIGISSTSGIYTINTSNVPESASLVTNVFNKTASTIYKGSVVYINGGQGDQPTIQLAIASTEIGSSKTYGIVQNDILSMSAGKVVVAGALTGVNTDTFNPTAPVGDVNGTTLWLSPSVSGTITTIKPAAPYHMVSVGTIVRTHQNEGVIEVRIQNGFELEELHNVAISGVTNGQFLQYDSDSSLWIPSSSGNFSTLLVNGNGVSISGHTHSSSDITDFNISVSGLIPVTSVNGQIGDISLDISKQIPYWDAESTYYDRIMVYHSDKLYIANTSNAGEEPDLYASLKTWTQIGGVSDIVGGSNITVIPSGSIYTISVSGSLGLTTEEVDDRVSNLLVAGSGIALTYNDSSNTLAVSVSGLSNTINIGDGSGNVIGFSTSETLNVVGSGSTTVTYNDASNTINISSPSLIREYELISSTKSTFSVTGGYALNNLDVYHNGIKLLASGDYTATNGTSFSLVQPAVSGDVVEWLGYSVVPRHQLILGEVRSDTVDNVNYLGRAVAGSPESSGVWTIKKYTVADNGVDITTGTATNEAWTNRLSVSYI